MPRRALGMNVFEAAVMRMERLYREGHRIVLSFSAGKDSGVCLEIMRIAARNTGKGPVEIIMRDEEIMFPGTFEYAERIYHQPDIKFHWVIAGQPIINSFNREAPYWWVFDDRCPELWLRKPPEWAERIEDKDIQHMTIPSRFPPPPGKDLISVIGLRVSESRNRKMGLMSSGDYVTKPNEFGVKLCRPVYDWTDDDVWKAILDMKWDYNKAYDEMYRIGMPKSRLRIAPPTMYQSIDSLQYARALWPKWFDAVNTRVGGLRLASMFGKRSISPIRELNETWEDCAKRIFTPENSPAWIIERYKEAETFALNLHNKHSTQPFPQNQSCKRCQPAIGCWKNLCKNLYMGDPWAQYCTKLPYIEPEFFRKGAGQWGGKPNF